MFDYEKQIRNIENYTTKEIKINTEDTAVVLYGTLITPQHDFDKIVVIVPGSGNISQYGYNFIAEYFLENNIGVFRFDRRGLGKSSGTLSGDINKYSADLFHILSTVNSLPSSSGKSVGALGHSQGGIAIMEALKEGAELDFLIQWTTPVGKPRDIVEYQIKMGSGNYDKSLGGKSLEERITVLNFVHEIIDTNRNEGTWDIWRALKKEGRKRRIKRSLYRGYFVHYNVLFAKLDNTEMYEILDIPTLFLIGNKDILVDPVKTAQALENIDNKHITVKKFENLNHFLREKDLDMSSLTNEIFNVDVTAKEYIINWMTDLNDNSL